MLLKNRENGGEGVCLPQIQTIDYESFFRIQVILPHSSHHIKIRVTEASFLSALDFVEGGGA